MRVATAPPRVGSASVYVWGSGACWVRSCRKRLVSVGTVLGVGERGTKTDRAHSYPTAELRATQEEAAKQP